MVSASWGVMHLAGSTASVTSGADLSTATLAACSFTLVTLCVNRLGRPLREGAVRVGDWYMDSFIG